MKALALIKFRYPQTQLVQLHVIKPTQRFFSSDVEVKPKTTSTNGVLYFILGVGAAIGAEEWYRNYNKDDFQKFEKGKVRKVGPLDDLADDLNKILSKYAEEHAEYNRLFEENVLQRKEIDALLSTFTLERERWIKEHAETYSNLETTTTSLRKVEQELGAKTQLFDEVTKLYEQAKDEIHHWRQMKEHVEGEFSTTRKDLEHKIKDLESRTPVPLIFGTGLIFGVVAAGLLSLFWKSS